MNEKIEGKLSANIQDNINTIQGLFQNDITFKTRVFQNRNYKEVRFCLFFIDNMVVNETLNENIIRPCLEYNQFQKNQNLMDQLVSTVLTINDIQRTDELDTAVLGILYGNTVLFVDGAPEALILETKGYKVRNISEPESERILRGPREGFTESLLSNLSMLRRKLSTCSLKLKFRSFGVRTNTMACICWLEGIADPKIVKELEHRLDKINIDGIMDINIIAEQIKDSHWTPIKMMYNTERPDVTASKLLGGRIALFLDGTPVVLIMPILFVDYFQSNDDYYINFYFSTLSRLLRLIGFFLSTSVPALYVAITTYNQEMLQIPLVISISMSRQNVPFPTIIEAFVLTTVFELLRESGVRMPSTIGQTLGVVGAIVVGTAAVEAKLVSAPIIIIVATAGITGLLIPRLKGIVILLRFINLIAVAIMGLYGYMFVLIAFSIHLFNLRSFGVSIMSQFHPNEFQDVKDTFIRSPFWLMKKRPKEIPLDKVRNNPGGKK